MAISNSHRILKKYRDKIVGVRNHLDYLPLEGKDIVRRYENDINGYKSLLEAAAKSKDFFLGIGDEALIAYTRICDRLNTIFDLNVSGSRPADGFLEERFVVRSAEEIITGTRTVEIGRRVKYNLGTVGRDSEDKPLFNRHYIEWEVEDGDNNFTDAHNLMATLAENITDCLDNSFSNPYDRTFEAVKEGHYIIKAKVHDLITGDIVDIIEFEQIVESGEETIMAMDFQNKIFRALELTNWKIDLDFEALSQGLFVATGVIIAIKAVSAFAPAAGLAIVAIMTAGMGIDATINIIKGIVQLAEALQLIEKARSERALQVGGEKVKEGILNAGVGIIELLLKKLTMKNLAEARTQVLRNATPKPPELPQTSFPTANATSTEIVTAVNRGTSKALATVSQMSVLQSEKAALQEMVGTEKLPEIDTIEQVKSESKIISKQSAKNSNTISRNNVIVKQIEQETSSEVLRELAAKNNIKKQLSSKIKEVGWTEELFAEKVVKPISSLNDEELLKIKQINEVIPNPTNETLMSKVITEKTYLNYISNGEYSDTIGNCLTKAEDLFDCKTYMDYYNKLGLNYFVDGKPSPYSTAEKMYIVRFTSGETEAKVVRNLGGTNDIEVSRIKNLYKDCSDISVFKQDDPFVGNGFTKTPSGELGKPEYNTIGYCQIKNGAAIYKLGRNGPEELVAVRIDDIWIPLGDEK